MKLPIPSLKKKNKQKYILALLLRDEKISAIITEEIEGKMRIVGQHEELLSTPLETLSPEAWLDTLDRAISRAEETLPPDRETHDTVFGVKESWVEEKKIKKEYLMKLKKLSETLSLTPIGFLVINEAVAHLIEAEEGAPVSAILVDIGNRVVTTTLVRGGKILENHTLPKGESLTDTVDTAMKHLTSVEVFPSRLILFLGNTAAGDKGAHEEVAQQFISHHWSKSLPFLHPPQISVLAAGFDAKAMVQGAASQMGFEVLNLTTAGEEEIRTFDQQARAPEKKTDEKEESEKDEEELNQSTKKDSEEAEAEETAKEATEEKSEETADTLPSEDFGFVMDEDITKHRAPSGEKHHPPKETEEPAEQKEAEVPHHAHHPEEASDDELDETDGENAGPLAFLSGIAAAIPIGKITAALPLKRLNFKTLAAGPRNKLLIIPVIVLLLLVGLYFLYTANVKANVTLYLKPNNVTETTSVLFATDSGNNFAENTIAAKTVSAELDGSVSSTVSGKKQIGEKAKGTVTIFNNDAAKRQIAAGTTIATDKGLKFTLDKDASVASASGDIFSGTKPGTVQITVTAAEIGSDYNLPSGTKFNVSGGSNLAAKNDSAFSGGTSKDVTVVSKKDQDKLVADLSKSLQDKAKEELAKKATGDEKLLPFLTQAAVTDKTFDHKVDQEAKSLKLNGTVSYEALVYAEKDIKDYAEVTLKNKYNDSLNLSEKGVQYELANEKQKAEDQVAADLRIQAGLVPKIDTTSVVQTISGKSLKEAAETLNKLPQVARSEIKLSPSLPFLSAFLPKSADKIHLTTALDE